MTTIEPTTTYHEAGHIIACQHLGVFVDRVSVVPEGTSLGRVYRAPAPHPFGCIIALAGPSAELRYREENNLPYDRAPGSRSDLARVIHDARKHGNEPDIDPETLSRRFRFERWLGFASEIVDSNWTVLESMARHLIRQPTMSALCLKICFYPRIKVANQYQKRMMRIYQ